MPETRFDLDGYVSAWNAMDLDAILAYYADDARVTRSSVMTPWEGIDLVRAGIANYLSAWRDLQVTPRNAIESGDTVAVVLSYSGTHARAAELAPGARIPASGRQVAHDIAHFLSLDAEGRIVRDEGILDMLSLLGQLGASPEVLARTAMVETGVRSR